MSQIQPHDRYASGANGNDAADAIVKDGLGRDAQGVHGSKDGGDQLSKSRGKDESVGGDLSRVHSATGELGGRAGGDRRRLYKTDVHSGGTDGRGLSDHAEGIRQTADGDVEGQSQDSIGNAEAVRRDEGIFDAESQAYAAGDERDERRATEDGGVQAGTVPVGDGQSGDDLSRYEEGKSSSQLGAQVRRGSDEEMTRGSSLGSGGDHEIGGISEGQGRGGESTERISDGSKQAVTGISGDESASGIVDPVNDQNSEAVAYSPDLA